MASHRKSSSVYRSRPVRLQILLQDVRVINPRNECKTSAQRSDETPANADLQQRPEGRQPLRVRVDGPDPGRRLALAVRVVGDDHHAVGVRDPHVAQVLVCPQQLRVVALDVLLTQLFGARSERRAI